MLFTISLLTVGSGSEKSSAMRSSVSAGTAQLGCWEICVCCGGAGFVFTCSLSEVGFLCIGCLHLEHLPSDGPTCPHRHMAREERATVIISLVWFRCVALRCKKSP